MRRIAFLVLGLTVAVGLTTAQGTLEERVNTLEQKMNAMEAGGGGGAGDFRVYWKNGLRFETADKHFQLKVGGRMQLDYIMRTKMDSDVNNMFKAMVPASPEPRQRLRYRRARLYLSGTVYEVIAFKFQYDFAQGGTAFKDVWMAIRKVPGLGNIRVGQFKEPFSLEDLTSSNYITFMERSLANVFAPARSTGIMAHDSVDDMITWAVGVFKDTNGTGDKDTNGPGSDWVFTGRVTAAPVYDDNGSTVVHVGLAASHRNVETGTQMQWGQKPEINSVNAFSGSGVFMPKTVTLVGAEAAAVMGPFSAQGEYIYTTYDSDVARNNRFYGWYLQGSFFVTGEHRNYDRKKAAFTRVKVKKNLGADDGFGAVELAARVSQLRFDRGSSTGSAGNDIINYTLGANWHTTPNSRLMLNWIITRPQGSNVWHFVGMRFQVDF